MMSNNRRRMFDRGFFFFKYTQTKELESVPCKCTDHLLHGRSYPCC